MISRTRRRDIGTFTTRKLRTEAVPFTPEQRAVHDAILDVQRAVYRQTQWMRLDSGVDTIRDEIAAALTEARLLPESDPKLDRLLTMSLALSAFRHMLIYLGARLAPTRVRISLIQGDVATDERRTLRRGILRWSRRPPTPSTCCCPPRSVRDCCARWAPHTPAGLAGTLFYRGRISDWCPLRFGTRFRRALLPAQTERAVDQTDMAIGLRKIAQHAAGQRIQACSRATQSACRRQAPTRCSHLGRSLGSWRCWPLEIW